MRKKLLIWGGAGLTLLLLSILLGISLSSTSVPIPFRDIVRILLSKLPWVGDSIVKDWQPNIESIIWKVRLPRVLLGVLVGAALALAGAAFQGVLRNPLADPFTLGVSSGASIGAAFMIYFGLQLAVLGHWTVPIVAFATAIATLWVVIKLAQIDGKIKMETLILAGIVLQALLGAVVSFMIAMSHQAFNEIVYWMMGSLAMKSWSYVAVLVPYLGVGFIILLSYARSLNLLALGERHAAHLGIPVERTKLIVLGVATLVTAAAVSVSGVIGFIGLIIPHMVRLMVGPDYRLILPLSAIGGGIYVVLADTIARTVLKPTDIPLGIVTAFIGALFFGYLLKKHKRSLQGGA